MRYPKECVLKECQEAVIRPMERTDKASIELFFSKISEDDRWFMRHDVLNPQILDRWFDQMMSDDMRCIIAMSDDRIVGQGSLCTRGYGATCHVGRFHIIVLPEFRQKRLGTWMLLDIIQLSMDEGLEALRTDLVMGVDDNAIDAMRKFDFFKEAVVSDYAKDREGRLHDMAVMVKRLHRKWSDF